MAKDAAKSHIATLADADVLTVADASDDYRRKSLLASVLRTYTSMTGAEILALLLPVDGSGSGLDADRLDGNNGTFYAQSATNIIAGTGLSGGGTLGSGGGSVTLNLNINSIGSLTVASDADKLVFYDDSGGVQKTITIANFRDNVLGGPFDSGTWSPTSSNLLYVSAASATEAMYIRVGNIVFFMIEASVTYSSASTPKRIDFTLPVSSNLAADSDLGGIVLRPSLTLNGYATGLIANDTMRWRAYETTSSGNGTYYIVGAYKVI